VFANVHPKVVGGWLFW